MEEKRVRVQTLVEERVRRLVKAEAALRGDSLEEWVAGAIEQRLERDAALEKIRRDDKEEK